MHRTWARGPVRLRVFTVQSSTSATSVASLSRPASPGRLPLQLFTLASTRPPAAPLRKLVCWTVPGPTLSQ